MTIVTTSSTASNNSTTPATIPADDPLVVDLLPPDFLSVVETLHKMQVHNNKELLLKTVYSYNLTVLFHDPHIQKSLQCMYVGLYPNAYFHLILFHKLT